MGLLSSYFDSEFDIPFSNYSLQMFKFFVSRFRKDETGASLVEYGLLVGLIAVVAIAAVTLLGSTIADYFGEVQDAMTGEGG